MRNLSLAGADRFSTSSCWRRNATSASRAACNLNNPTANPPSSFKRSSILQKVAHRCICATPDEIFGSDRKTFALAVSVVRSWVPRGVP
jgi:hypothetical protein